MLIFLQALDEEIDALAEDAPDSDLDDVDGQGMSWIVLYKMHLTCTLSSTSGGTKGIKYR